MKKQELIDLLIEHDFNAYVKVFDDTAYGGLYFGDEPFNADDKLYCEGYAGDLMDEAERFIDDAEDCVRAINLIMSGDDDYEEKMWRVNDILSFIGDDELRDFVEDQI